MCDQRSQDLSVLLMQAVYLHTALFTSVGVSQITCNCGSLYFAWCFSWSGTSHNVLKRAVGRIRIKKKRQVVRS